MTSMEGHGRRMVWTGLVLVLVFASLSQFVPHVHVVCPHAVSCGTQVPHPHHSQSHDHGDDGDHHHHLVLTVHVDSHCLPVLVRATDTDAGSAIEICHADPSLADTPCRHRIPDGLEVPLKTPPPVDSDPRAPPFRDRAVL